jgi:antitoxin component YwqK of YwqJK toxin-antitoxin module
MPVTFYKNGAIHSNYNPISGHGLIYTEDGRILYEGQLSPTPRGYGREYYPTGQLKYEGEWADGKYHGKGCHYD